jgi:hypothetical protein
MVNCCSFAAPACMTICPLVMQAISMTFTLTSVFLPVATRHTDKATCLAAPIASGSWTG